MTTGKIREAMGGSAFPEGEGTTDGLTVLDYFAAAALTGLAIVSPGKSETTATIIAETAYAVADAMLTERAVRVAVMKSRQ